MNPLCIVVNYCEGGSLYSYLRKKKNELTFEHKRKIYERNYPRNDSFAYKIGRRIDS